LPLENKKTNQLFFFNIFLLLIIIFSLYFFIEKYYNFNLVTSNFIVYGEDTTLLNETTLLNKKASSNISNIGDFTLLIYIIASNLGKSAATDIDEMLKSNLTNPAINLLVQIGGGEEDDKFSNTQRYVIFNNTKKTKDMETKDNMADDETLAKFIKWGISEYPAKKYGLILWDHGAAINGFGADLNYKNVTKLLPEGDALHLSEIKSLKNTLISDLNYTNLEFIGFDSCLMSTIEVATVLSSNIPLSKYMIASEEIEPNWGWNYRTIIDSISHNTSITGDLLGKDIIHSYIEQSEEKSRERKFHADRDITLSSIDLTKITTLNEKLDNLTEKIIYNVLGSNHSFIKFIKVIDETEKFGQGASEDYKDLDLGMIDIADFLNNLGNAFKFLEQDAKLIKNEIETEVVKYNYTGKSHPNSKGISIYLPISEGQFKRMNMNDFSDKDVPVMLYSQYWKTLVDFIKNKLSPNTNLPPVLKSVKINNTIYFHILKPDIKNIFLEITLNSSKGKPIVYYQKLDPSVINEYGYFNYSKNRIVALCDESKKGNLCIPASVNKDATTKLTKYFMNVQINKKGSFHESTLVYEHQDGKFFFLGGVDHLVIKPGNDLLAIKRSGGEGNDPVSKEKINIEKGDLIYTQGIADEKIKNASETLSTAYSYHINKPFIIEDPKTIFYKTIDKLNGDFIFDHYLNVTDPSKIKPKIIDIKGPSIVQFYVSDYSNNWSHSRPYVIDSNYTMSESMQEKKYNPKSLFNSFNNSYYTYINNQYDFQLEYPINWFSVTQDIDDDIYLNDPKVLSIYPEEVLNDTKWQRYNPPHVTISVEDKDNWTIPNTYVSDYFKNIDGNYKDFKYKTKIKGVEEKNTTSFFMDNIPAKEAIFEIERKTLDNTFTTITKGYFFVTSMNGKIYLIGFETDKLNFKKYLQEVKNIINTFNVGKFDERKLDRKNYQQIEEKERFKEFKDLIDKQGLNKYEWRVYTDKTFNFNISLPYLHEFDTLVDAKKCKKQLNSIVIDDCYFRYVPNLPYFNFLGDTSKSSNFLIFIINESKISDNWYSSLKEKLRLLTLRDVNGYKFSDLFKSIQNKPNYTLYHSYMLPLTGNFTGVVDRESVMSPIYDDKVQQSHLYTIVDGKFFSLILQSPYSDPNHETLFKTIAKSFKYNKK
jgi:hypothetical protein